MDLFSKKRNNTKNNNKIHPINKKRYNTINNNKEVRKSAFIKNNKLIHKFSNNLINSKINNFNKYKKKIKILFFKLINNLQHEI